ncbi:hypothetical protein NQ317_002436 [Molorchus minor]|uniref:DDE Tnp4 domain-containing protein n=1 Tax=Molorchus minor TaxID=1323400 RepID=A0ABQ9IXB6_9CUCU|nr:hypothetical protein NQ317_002436 [Molorchus minor]
MLLTSLTLLMKKKRFRRYAVRPINRQRRAKGIFNNLLYSMVQKDHESFFKYTRMTPTQFTCLLRLVGPYLQKDKTKNPISPEQRLMITIHYLAEGCSMQEIAWNYMIGHATASVIIRETTAVLWNVLSPKFTLVDIGAAGSNHDSVVFEESGFGQAIIKDKMPLPEPRPVSEFNPIVLPYFFVADAAFPLKTNIKTKYCPSGYVDCTTQDGEVSPGAWRAEGRGLRSVGRLRSNNSKATARENRDRLCEYFSSEEGALPWQREHILQGALPDNF